MCWIHTGTLWRTFFVCKFLFFVVCYMIHCQSRGFVSSRCRNGAAFNPNEAQELTTNHHINLSGKSAFLAAKDKPRTGDATRELSSQSSCEVASRFKDGGSQLAKLEMRHSTLQLLRTDVVKQLRCVMCAELSRGR